jgi:putative NIF3 family GTP cyclohydrolase 1 type 2
MERAEEDRLEALVPERALRTVLAEVRQAHPYEEVAFDVFPLHEADPAHGLGLVGLLPTKTPLRQFAQQARHVVGEDFAQFAGDAKWPVKRVAIITGSAGGVARIVTKKMADVIVTGELNYHTALDVTAAGVGVVALGHAASERVFAPYFCRVFAEVKSVADAEIELVPYTKFPEPWKLVRPAEEGAQGRRKS